MDASVIALPSLRRRRDAGTRDAAGLSDQECFAVAAAMRHDNKSWMPARDEDPYGAVVMALLPYNAQDNADYVIGRALGGFFLESSFRRQTFTSLAELLAQLSRLQTN